MKVKFSIPEIYTNDINHVSKILKSGWLTHGNIMIFLKMNLKNLQAQNMLFLFQVVQLDCIYPAYQLVKGGDEVIVPSQTHTATAHAVECTGAKAIFSDVDPITGNILVNDVNKLQIKLRRCYCSYGRIPCKIKDLIFM